MLHEILLGLSGHPSGLLNAVKQEHDQNNRNPDSIPSLSVSEKGLLLSIAHIAELHSQLQSRAKAISESHRSTACQAVATAISSQQLTCFQDHILDVEKRILTKNSNTVGAYDIVPLAFVVNEFQQWRRRLEWLWEIVLFMSLKGEASSRDSNKGLQCSTAQIIDHLRKSLQTGYPDIEETANDLTKVAEIAWLRQLSTWILYGRLPQNDHEDFCIRLQDLDNRSTADFSLVPELLPKFVTTATGSSILFIGKSLNQIRAYRNVAENQSRGLGTASELKLLPEHLRLLSNVKPPVSVTQLSRAIASIRLSLSRNTLQELLPLPKIVQFLRVLQQFFLLGHGEFASTLISEVDSRISTQNTTAGRSRRAPRNATEVLPKEGEVNAILARTWSILSSMTDEDSLDEDMELARDLIRLTPVSVSSNAAEDFNGQALIRERSYGNIFKDVLFSGSCILAMQIPAPFDLFLAQSELVVYTDINSYLIGLRRAQLRLAGLWKHTSLRRDHPAPLGPPQSSSSYGQNALRARRERGRKRRLTMRKVWATCGAALFLLSEITSYFEGEIVQESWQHFRKWITRSDESRPSSASSSQPSSAVSDATSSKPPTLKQQLASTFATQASIIPAPAQDAVPHDPETISAAHRIFLATLVYSLLLNDANFTSKVRMLISNVDGLIAHIKRLEIVQQNLDLETDEGVIDALTDYNREEQETLLEMDRGRKRLDGSMKSVVGRLRELDRERIGGGAGLRPTETNTEADVADVSTYQSWMGGGIDRLLMKLDFGRGMVEDEGIEMKMA